MAFEIIEKTAFPPKDKPVMIWDGECGFCKYWTTRWQLFTKEKIEYVPYQEIANKFKDIDIKHFKQASRLIELDGSIYSGPRSAYRTFTYGSIWGFLDKWYDKIGLFKKMSDLIYNKVATNRSFMFKLTKFMFGSDPENTKPFWAIYLCVVLYLIYSLVFR